MSDPIKLKIQTCNTAIGFGENTMWSSQRANWAAAALAILFLSGFTGFWAPGSFEECRDKVARDAKTEAGLGVPIESCRKQFPKLSELKDDWARFATAIKSHKYNSAIPRRRTEPVARTEGFLQINMAANI